MPIKSAKPKAPRRTTPVAIEDDERHSEDVDAFITRNRDALNASIEKSRRDIAAGKGSTRSIDEIIAEGRRRHAKPD